MTRTHFGVPGALFSGVNNVDYVRVYVPKGSVLIDASGFSIPDDALFEKPEDGWEMDDDLLFSEALATEDPGSKTAVYEENGKTVFGNWVQTKPGTSSTYRFRYRVPVRVSFRSVEDSLMEKTKSLLGIPDTSSYSLFVQTQPGIVDRTLRVHLRPPEGIQTVWSSHDLLNISVIAGEDVFVRALFERP
jgi:hypothetical protein